MSRTIHRQSLERVMADRATREAGSRMHAHHFHSYYELFCVEQGSVNLMIGNGSYDLMQGEFFLIPPHVFHCSLYPDSRCVRSVVYFRSQDISRRTLGLFSDPDRTLSQPQILSTARDDQPLFEELLSRMTREDRQTGPVTEPMMYFYLQELLLLLYRFGTVREVLPLSQSVSNEQVLAAAQFINTNYMQPIAAADIAAASGFSPNHLSKKFREVTGIGAHEYLVQVRLQHAALALSSTEDSITQIALRCGFSESNYFKDVFKMNYGLTPREYRKRHAER